MGYTSCARTERFIIHTDVVRKPDALCGTNWKRFDFTKKVSADRGCPKTGHPTLQKAFCRTGKVGALRAKPLTLFSFYYLLVRGSVKRRPPSPRWCFGWMAAGGYFFGLPLLIFIEGKELQSSNLACTSCVPRTASFVWQLIVFISFLLLALFLLHKVDRSGSPSFHTLAGTCLGSAIHSSPTFFNLR